MRGHREKFISNVYDLSAWRAEAAMLGQRVVVTNGCFDVLHIGHVHCLTEARKLGDLLMVGINGDDAVTLLKGVGRPINLQVSRAFMLGALECVDAVYIFNSVNAANFLKDAMPNVWVKGGDYTLDTLDPLEKEAVYSSGGKIVISHTVQTYSTTNIIERMKQCPSPSLKT